LKITTFLYPFKLILPPTLPIYPLTGSRISRTKFHTSRSLTVKASAADDDDIRTVGLAAVAVGALANPICLWSLYTLQTTGDGFPAGPYGLYGAAEGISYLVVTAIVGWSVFTKVQTGSGLPAGPGGALGAVEGVSFLTILIGLVVGGLKFAS